jgi:hypothetical protein
MVVGCQQLLGMGQSKFVNIAEWCSKNGMDSISVLAIAKKQDACFKIGSGCFVDNEEDLCNR